MSSEGEQPAPPQQSVFISYASGDRDLVRPLRDHLTASGLDVWFDENELGGGDAWDAKIRRQIRDCDYFMPVISAETEQRKEGYFRREWRLAVERTMDLADDVLFLVPVVIDETSESYARVPDKFLSVQWIRLVGGQPNEALDLLCQRMRAGDHRPPPPLHRPHGAKGTTRPPLPASSRSSRSPEEDRVPHSLPMPPFPHPPEKGSGLGHGLRFVAEVLWWGVNSIWSIVQRLPRWAQVMLLVWVIIMGFSRLSRNDPPDTRPRSSRPPPTSAQAAEFKRAMRKVSSDMAEQKEAARKSGKPGEFESSQFMNVGEKVARAIAAGLDDAADRQLAVVPFYAPVADSPDAKVASGIFTAFYGKIVMTLGEKAGFSKDPVEGGSEQALIERGKSLDSAYILQASLGSGDAAHSMVVKLFHSKDAKLAWSGTYPLAEADPVAVAEQAAAGVLEALPK